MRINVFGVNDHGGAYGRVCVFLFAVVEVFDVVLNCLLNDVSLVVYRVSDMAEIMILISDVSLSLTSIFSCAVDFLSLGQTELTIYCYLVLLLMFGH